MPAGEPAEDPAEDIVVVGRLGSPYGIQGWLHLQSFTTPPENLLNYQPWFIQASKGGSWRTFGPSKCRPHKKGFVAQLAGIPDREQAAAVTGSLVGVRRDTMPDPDAGCEYYWRDLVGCRVVTEAGTALGEVDHLLETGAHDVMSVLATDDAGRREANPVLIPFAAKFVVAVDIDQRLITVAWDPDW